MAAVIAEVGTDRIQDVVDAFQPTGIISLPRIVDTPDELPPGGVPITVPEAEPGLDLSEFTCYWNLRENTIVCMANRYLPPEEQRPMFVQSPRAVLVHPLRAIQPLSAIWPLSAMPPAPVQGVAQFSYG